MRLTTMMISAATVLLVTGCGTTEPTLQWSNGRSGVVSYDGSSEAKAMRKADDYCRSASHSARVTSVNANDSTITFDCVE